MVCRIYRSVLQNINLNEDLWKKFRNMIQDENERFGFSIMNQINVYLSKVLLMIEKITHPLISINLEYNNKILISNSDLQIRTIHDKHQLKLFKPKNVIFTLIH